MFMCNDKYNTIQKHVMPVSFLGTGYFNMARLIEQNKNYVTN